MAQAITPSKMHIQNSQVWTSHTYTACTLKCLKAATYPPPRTSSKLTHSQIATLTCCAFSPSIYSCRWIKVLVSSVTKTVRLRTSAAFSPNRPPTSCAHGCSSTLRWVCQSNTASVNIPLIFSSCWFTAVIFSHSTLILLKMRRNRLLIKPISLCYKSTTGMSHHPTGHTKTCKNNYIPTTLSRTSHVYGLYFHAFFFLMIGWTSSLAKGSLMHGDGSCSRC